MPLELGIGIATYNRRDVLAATLDRVERHTKYPFTKIVVADDGSTDGTADMLASRKVTTVSGTNMGIAWNKNRALFLATELLRCDIVILLEDDAFPVQDNWELEWMNAALRWGHVNVAGPWMQNEEHAGAGTLDDPIRSTSFTAQCQVFSREAVLMGGYYDSRYRGYGHEHVEHTVRLGRAGYGGEEEVMPDGTARRIFYLLWGGLGFAPTRSVIDHTEIDKNYALTLELFEDLSYRAPWRDEQEMQQFREEMRNARPRVL